jgi:hypothetical protein
LYDIAVSWTDANEPLVREALQRFAHWCATDTKFASQLLLDEALTWRELAEQNSLTQLLFHAL